MTTEITLTQLEQSIAAGEPVLDVREPHEYAAGHVPGARLLPLGVLPAVLHDLPKDKTINVICQAGGRSQQAGQLLERAGFTARSVAGGTAGWVSSGRPVESGAPRS